MSDEPLGEGRRKRFRQAVTDSLLAAGFVFDPDNRDHLSAHDGGKMFVYNLPYTQVSHAVASLRPGVKVEISSWPLQRAPVSCSVASFLAQARDNVAEVPEINCVDVAETAADKFVALTRRVAEEQAGDGTRDPSLLRHVYDLHRTRPGIDLDAVRPMLQAIMESDRKTRGRKLPSYAEDPKAVSLDAIRVLSEDDGYAGAFSVFQRDMVYGSHVALADCLPVLREYAALL